MICFDAASALGMAAARTSASDGTVRAPMMGKIILVDAVIGQEVKTGERLAALESMKMELAVNAPCNGRVAAVECRADNTVERDQILFRIEPL